MKLDALIERAQRTVSYKRWKIFSEPVYSAHGERTGALVSWAFLAEDNMQPDNPELFACRTRRWFVPVTADWTDLVNTLWLAVEIGERHESMELFRVDGQVLRDPHTRLPAQPTLEPA